ncbi:hypothetical protein ANN_07169 [Periplaneta americana]|uniref:Uncharacterized protein n=1 Tax=Periplaneta americana TaxID=6978 RepID=A0ABQ8TG57_PERAM|nr:hypothetical protein ANN_07169 [Periplaneta americana]
MAGLCEGGIEPPRSLKAKEKRREEKRREEKRREEKRREEKRREEKRREEKRRERRGEEREEERRGEERRGEERRGEERRGEKRREEKRREEKRREEKRREEKRREEKRREEKRREEKRREEKRREEKRQLSPKCTEISAVLGKSDTSQFPQTFFDNTVLQGIANAVVKVHEDPEVQADWRSRIAQHQQLRVQRGSAITRHGRPQAGDVTGCLPFLQRALEGSRPATWSGSHASLRAPRSPLGHATIRPIMEYGAVGWDPYRKNQIDSIEKVQRKAAKYVKMGKGHGEEIVKDIGWELLKSRRRKTRLTALFKLEETARIHQDIEKLEAGQSPPRKKKKYTSLDNRIARIVDRFLDKVQFDSRRLNLNINKAISDWKTLTLKILAWIGLVFRRLEWILAPYKRDDYPSPTGGSDGIRCSQNESNKSFEVHEEVHCVASEGGGIRRADIVALDKTNSKGFILDPTVRFEISQTQPSEVNKEKQQIYEPTIPYFREKYQMDGTWEVHGLMIGARGTIPRSTVNTIKTFGIHDIIPKKLLQPLKGLWQF